jgi:hypothetical protein
MKPLLLSWLAVALLALSGAGGAAPIYRCGNTYSQTPCPGGKLVDASDPRTAAQRAEARRIAAKEKRDAARAAKAAASGASGAASSPMPAASR